ncbi:MULTISPECIES: hypothetical protein [Cysteiniphilum]|uniref:hypothetical protein n=1 Tax=Cysteiniphilum TaxID=2056696 RepID=UPI00177E8F09|nr:MULTISPECIES: hypothetical protein [Cysteiniphilum]
MIVRYGSGTKADVDTALAASSITNGKDVQLLVFDVKTQAVASTETKPLFVWDGAGKVLGVQNFSIHDANGKVVSHQANIVFLDTTDKKTIKITVPDTTTGTNATAGVAVAINSTVRITLLIQGA